MRHRQEERSSNKRFRMRQTKQEKAKIEERERNGATSMYINWQVALTSIAEKAKFEREREWEGLVLSGGIDWISLPKL